MFHTSVEIVSDLSKISEGEEFIDSIMEECHMEATYRGILCTPLCEAVKNAIIHGNRMDRHKKVRILCQQDHGQWTFAVSDEGKGFSYENFTQQRITALSHGLSIIRTLCEEVTFQNNGSTIVFRMLLPKPKQEAAPKEWIQKVMKQYFPQYA